MTTVAENLEAAPETVPTCPTCARREAAKRDEELRYRRRRKAQRAAELFKTRRLICEILAQARRLECGGRSFSPNETPILPTLVCTIGQNCDAAIESLADAAKGDHPDLSDGIRLLLDFHKRGGGAKYELGIDDTECQEWQAVITATIHQMDAQNWQRLYELRDVIAELLDDTPAGQPPGDEIPF